MEILLVLFCCGSLVVTTAFGLGMTLVLERLLGGWAYVVGAILPVVIFTGLYTLYHIYVRAIPCDRVDSLACGQPFLTAFFLFAGVAFFLLIANILAQTSLYLYVYGSRQTTPTALYETPGDDSGAAQAAPEGTGQAMGAPAAAVQAQTEPVAEMPVEEQDVDEDRWSGLPSDAPEEEQPPNPPAP